MTRPRSTLVPAVALLVAAASAQQGPTPLPSLVTASGNAEVKIAPDMATIRIGVGADGKTAKEAQERVNILAQRLIAAALRIVPDRKAYQTADLSLEPQYLPSGGRNEGAGGGFGGSSGPNAFGNTDKSIQVLVGYHAQNTLTVRLDDISKVGPLVDAVTDAGATNVDGIAFGLKDDKPLRKQALMEAVRDAREKAEAMAAGLGLRIGGVYSVEEGGGTVVRPFEMRAMAKMADAPVMPGEVSTSASVTVRFILAPATPAGFGR